MSEVVKTSAGVKAFFNWSIWRFLSIAGYILCKPNLIIGSKQAFAAENLNWVGWEIWLFCPAKGGMCRICGACPESIRDAKSMVAIFCKVSFVSGFCVPCPAKGGMLKIAWGSVGKVMDV